MDKETIVVEIVSIVLSITILAGLLWYACYGAWQ